MISTCRSAFVCENSLSCVPDTACTMCDLYEALNVSVAAFARIPPDVVGPLLADCADDPQLRAAFMAQLFDPPRAAVARTLE